jgi:hypothetical protein
MKHGKYYWQITDSTRKILTAIIITAANEFSKYCKWHASTYSIAVVSEQLTAFASGILIKLPN